MLRWFKTDDGSLIDVREAIESGALEERYPRAYLELCADQREWKGKPSVTQLINGTRAAYLMILVDYAEDPDEQAFRVAGSLDHKKLDRYAKQFGLSEEMMEDADIRGTLDRLEPLRSGRWVITDFKRSGAYKVKTALGVVSFDEPVLDLDGNPVILKSGKNKGKQKTHKVARIDPSQRKVDDWALQLNRYRLLARDVLGIVVPKLRVFAIVRDGGTVAARMNGILLNTYMIPIPVMDDGEVMRYFTDKGLALLNALRTQAADESAGMGRDESVALNMPAPCSKEEAWDGRKCLGYCPVSGACIAHGDNPYIGAPEPETDEEQAAAVAE